MLHVTQPFVHHAPGLDHHEAITPLTKSNHFLAFKHVSSNAQLATCNPQALTIVLQQGHRVFGSSGTSCKERLQRRIQRRENKPTTAYKNIYIFYLFIICLFIYLFIFMQQLQEHNCDFHPFCTPCPNYISTGHVSLLHTEEPAAD